MRPVPKVEGLVVGLSLAAVGVVWTLANLGLVDLLTTLRNWWPGALVLWGGLELYNWRAEADRRALPPPPPPDEARWYEKDGDTGRTS